MTPHSGASTTWRRTRGGLPYGCSRASVGLAMSSLPKVRSVFTWRRSSPSESRLSRFSSSRGLLRRQLDRRDADRRDRSARISQDFRQNALALHDRGVPFAARYDRNALAKPPSRLCPRQHLIGSPFHLSMYVLTIHGLIGNLYLLVTIDCVRSAEYDSHPYLQSRIRSGRLHAYAPL
jgi:hypothetical protein